ncbi:unnamed protein product, partial [Ascophyllum nodosum]
MYVASGLIFSVASRFLPTVEALAMVANEFPAGGSDAECLQQPQRSFDKRYSIDG